MRFVRLLVGFLVIALLVILVAREHLAGASATATVNARLTTIRAPIEGRLALREMPLGARVVKGERVGGIDNQAPDSGRLGDLLMERQFAAAEIDRLSALEAAYGRSLNGLRELTKADGEDRIRRLEAELKAAQAELEIARQADGQVPEVANDGGEDASHPVAAADRSVGLSVRLAQDKAAAAEAALAAARESFKDIGSSSVPLATQEGSERNLKMAEIRADLAAAEHRLAAINSRISAARVQLSKDVSATLEANANGNLWQAIAADGEYVARGQPIMQIVACDMSMVTASVSQSVYNSLRMGDEAKFRLSGDSRVFPATVTRLAGSGAASIYSNLAVVPSAQQLERYDVTLSVPALARDPELACAIGRTGRVFFEARPLDFLRNLWNRSAGDA